MLAGANAWTPRRWQTLSIIVEKRAIFMLMDWWTDGLMDCACPWCGLKMPASTYDKELFLVVVAVVSVLLLRGRRERGWITPHEQNLFFLLRFAFVLPATSVANSQSVALGTPTVHSMTRTSWRIWECHGINPLTSSNQNWRSLTVYTTCLRVLLVCPSIQTRNKR